MTNPANGADGVGGVRGVRIADALRKMRTLREGGAKQADFVAGDGSGNVRWRSVMALIQCIQCLSVTSVIPIVRWRDQERGSAQAQGKYS
jgi:hypothetical protein